LDSFVPPRAFDVHCHLYHKAFFRNAVPALVEEFPQMDFHSFQRGITSASGMFDDGREFPAR
jgi:hypothetical protein